MLWAEEEDFLELKKKKFKDLQIEAKPTIIVP
jgi:hypothetical protein